MAAPVPTSGIYVPDRPELVAYYSDRRTLRRNMVSLLICNLGWGLSMTLVSPLMGLAMNERGVSEFWLGTISSVNSVLVAVLVMYFSWKSDHTVSRLGRRTPYLLISAPFVILPILIFPWMTLPVSLILLYAVHVLFMDLKQSTYALLPLDCVPRHALARFGSAFAIAGGVVTFCTLHWGFLLIGLGEWVPYILAGSLMVFTTLAALLLREPPIACPTTEAWRPWTTLKVGWKDRRTVLLMVGVTLLFAFHCTYFAWLWLYARNHLGVEKGMIAQAVSWAPLLSIALAWPVAWLVDRYAGIRLAAVYVLLEVVVCILVCTATGPGGILAASLAKAVAGPFFAGADILIVRQALPQEVGSVTSSSAFVRNLGSGLVVFTSGTILGQCGGDHRYAFIFGLAVSIIGFLLLLWYTLMPHLKTAAVVPAVEEPA